MRLLTGWIYMVLLNCSVAVSQGPVKDDIVINEVLFNPAHDGYDYVEGYNRSEKSINLEDIQLATRNATGDVAGNRGLSDSLNVIRPGEYFVITANEKWLRQNYLVVQGTVICRISSLPSFPDDRGTTLFLNKTGEILDELTYSEKWHYALITNAEGVALERINYDEPAQYQDNWTSASSSSGFGTPGYINSQFRADLQAQGEVMVSPEVITPDNDGQDDFGMIHYTMDEPGYTANLVIYDAAGRRVRYLLKNSLLGINGQFKWDGLDDLSNPLPSGVYILLTEIFNLKGKTKKFKHVIIVWRRSG